MDIEQKWSKWFADMDAHIQANVEFEQSGNDAFEKELLFLECQDLLAEYKAIYEEESNQFPRWYRICFRGEEHTQLELEEAWKIWKDNLFLY